MGASLNRSMRAGLNRCGEETSLLREVQAAEEGLEAGTRTQGVIRLTYKRMVSCFLFEERYPRGEVPGVKPTALGKFFPPIRNDWTFL